MADKVGKLAVTQATTNVGHVLDIHMPTMGTRQEVYRAPALFTTCVHSIGRQWEGRVSCTCKDAALFYHVPVCHNAMRLPIPVMKSFQDGPLQHRRRHCWPPTAVHAAS
jgi:hypothetical protein